MQNLKKMIQMDVQNGNGFTDLENKHTVTKRERWWGDK